MKLGKRETEVLQLTADGWPYKAIAMKLGCAEATVKSTHVIIRQKLDAVSSPNAVAVGFRKGILK